MAKSKLGSKLGYGHGTGMSAIGVEADLNGAKADIQTTPDSRACPSVSASLWFGGLRPRYA